MQFDDSINDSRNFLRIALEKLGKHNLPTSPLNYSIWYEYATGRNGALNAAIDQYLDQGESFSAAFANKIYRQYIAGGEESAATLAREVLKRLFAEISSAIQATRQDFTQSENTLESINDALDPTLTDTDIERIVERIKKEIKRLESSSSTFKDQLQQATVEIDQLKAKMAHYRKAALNDPLTRIANRRGFEEALDHAIRHVDQTGNPLCLIICDIDHFKRVNDTHGHLIGDNVIRMTAATLKDCIKGKDRVARIGGEEFAILLPDTPPEGALKLAENIRQTFEEMDLKKKNSGETLGQITLSFGVTHYRQGEAKETFINRADKALYASKENGRNRATRL